MCKSSQFVVFLTIAVLVNCIVEDNECSFNELLDDDNFKLIETDKGVVRGHRALDGDYFAFLGIPYAAPPIGRNRFKAPLPAASWRDVYEANRSVQCPQTGTGDEDCLVLNVFTPTKTKSNKLPVLVYIHGGSFLLNCGQTKGVEPLIKQDIIVITINYRLGVLGFLCLGTDLAPGNAGLKDQVAALKWVKRNIENFGGDPEHVTLYGMSAGAAAVELLLLSRNVYSKGLFQSAILESGSALNVWAINTNPISTAKDLAHSLNFTGATHADSLAEYFRTVPADVLSAVNYDYYNNLTDGTFGFVPCKEKYSPQAIVSEHPYTTVTKQKYKKMPMIVIFSTLEGLFLKSEQYYTHDYGNKMEKNFENFLPANLVFSSNVTKHDVTMNIKHVYFGNAAISRNTILGYLNYFGDSLILRGLLDSAKLHSTQPDAPKNSVYLMEFAYSGNMGRVEEFYKHIKVAGHGDAIKHAILEKPIRHENDKKTVERVSKLIANFVKFKNPTPFPTELLSTMWPEVTVGLLRYLHLDGKTTIQDNPYSERMTFWQKIYEDHEMHDIPMSPWTL